MKFVDEFRDGARARKLADIVHQEVDTTRNYRLMEFCGGHTHAIFRFGIIDLLPNSIQFIHGPGCPVCVLPAGRIEGAIQLVEREGITLCSYADLMRVPTSSRDSLHKAKARGGDIRAVYSPTDALDLARKHPHREIVFFAIGFETTTPPTAAIIRMAKAEGISNFTVYCNHVETPPAMMHILADGKCSIDGILGPSHVSTIIGSRAYGACCQDYHIPLVIAGFEPLDILQSVLMLVRQVNDGRAEVENQYRRAVRKGGNSKAQALMREVFEQREQFAWRGLGTLSRSAVQIRKQYALFDAERRFAIENRTSREIRGCICPAVLRGIRTPAECTLFATSCTPEDPQGACMVSSEGACAAYYNYGRHRGTDTTA